MASLSFQSTPCPTEEAAVAMVSGMISHAPPHGTTYNITNISVQEVGGLFIASAAVDVIVEEQPEDTKEDQSGGGQGGATVSAENPDGAEAAPLIIPPVPYRNAAEGDLVNDVLPEGGVPVSDVSAANEMTAQNAQQDTQADDAFTGANNTLTDNVEQISAQLRTDFNEPALTEVNTGGIGGYDVDQTPDTGWTDEDRRAVHAEAREEERRRELAEELASRPVAPEETLKLTLRG